MITGNDILFSKLDPWYFIKNFTKTFDERNTAQPINPFPDRPYFNEIYTIYDFKLSNDPTRMLKLIDSMDPLAEGWKIEFLNKVLTGKTGKIIASPKSRQVTVSWGIMAYFLHRCMFYDFQLVQILSKKETDSVYQVKRAKQMYQMLPMIFQEYSPLVRPIKKQAATVFSFANGSGMEAYAQGEEGPRSRSSTVLLLDEAQEQTYVNKVVKAAAGTNLIIMVGTANKGGEFQRYAEGTIGGN
jgi:hypothetical protein